MALKIDPQVVSIIVNAVGKSADGATLNDVIAAFAEPPDRRIAHRWLTSLVREGVLDVDPSSKAHRYHLLSAADEHLDTSTKTPDTRSDNHASHVSTLAETATESRDVDTSNAPSPNDVDTSQDGLPQTLGNAAKPTIPAPTNEVSTLKPKAPVPAHVDTSPSTPAATPHTVAKPSVHMAKPHVSISMPDARVSAPRRTHLETAHSTPPRHVDTSLAGAPGSVRDTGNSSVHLGAAHVSISAGNVTAGGHVDTSKTVVPGDVDTSSPGGGTTAIPTPGVRRNRVFLGAVCTLSIAIAAGAAWYWRMQHRPPEAEVGAYLARSLEPLPARTVVVDVDYGRVSAIGSALTYHVLLETTAPLFRRIDTREYLHGQAAAEIAAIDDANALLHGPSGDRVRAVVGPPPSAFELIATSAAEPFGRAILVVTQTPSQTKATAAGTLVGWRDAGAWRFIGDPVNVDRTKLAGEPKPGGAFAVDVAEEAARLRALIVECAAYATKVRTAADALERSLQPIESATATTPRGDQNAATPTTPSPAATAESTTPAPAASPTPTNTEPLNASVAAPTPPTDAVASDRSAELPQIATSRPTAYVLAGQWLPLPRNNPQVNRTGGRETADEISSDPVAELTFDGRYYVPVVSGEHLVLAYVGAVTWIASEQDRHSAPPITLAPENVLANGTRSAWLYRTAPGLLGFGRDGVAATVERTNLRVIEFSTEVPAVIVRCTAPLPPGRYALYCGRDSYELTIE
jgi:hypothetical protein